jgi:predicted PhzF superfamily epimerase YddE/YHI9
VARQGRCIGRDGRVVVGLSLDGRVTIGGAVVTVLDGTVTL